MKRSTKHTVRYLLAAIAKAGIFQRVCVYVSAKLPTNQKVVLKTSCRCGQLATGTVWFHALVLQLDNDVSQSTDQPMEPSATSTTDTGPVGDRLQAGTEDAPVLDRPASLRRLHDSGAGYKYSDLLTYLLTYLRLL